MYHLAARGWVCVAINYRLSPKATWPDHLVDCKRALAWVREHIAEYGGDPDYVVVTGGSAGGHLTAMMGLTPERPAVPARVRGGRHVGARDGPVLRRLRLDRPRRSTREARRAAAGARTSHREAALRRCARGVRPGVADVPRHADAPPALVVHGDLDTLAPVAEARRFVQMLRATSRAGRLRRAAAARTTRSTCSTRSARCTGRGRRPVPRLAAHRRPARSDCRARCACRRSGERCVSGGIGERSDDHGAYGAITSPARVVSTRVVVDAPAREVAPRLVAVGLHRHARRAEPLVDLVELLTRDR